MILISITLCTDLVQFENLVRQLKLAGASLEESDLLAELFLILSAHFDPLVTAKERFIAEETKLKETNINGDEIQGKMAFAGSKGRNNRKFKGKCFKCNKVSHRASDCRVAVVQIASGFCFMADC